MKKTDTRSLRERSISRLEEIGVQATPHLPFLEENNTSKFRRPEEIAGKIVACNFLSEINWGAKPKKILRWLDAENGQEYIASYDWNLLKLLSKKIVIKQKQKNELGWLRESAIALSFSGGLVTSIPMPDKEYNFRKLEPKIPPEVPIDKFCEGFKLISFEKLLEEVDFYYCLHAGLRHTNYSQYNMAVIHSRRHALEWIITNDLEWDEVSLDT